MSTLRAYLAGCLENLRGTMAEVLRYLISYVEGLVRELKKGGEVKATGRRMQAGQAGTAISHLRLD